MIWNPPNLLSLLRLLLTPVVVWLMHQGRYPAAFGVFWVAGWTDALDGYLARRFNWGTKLGTYLDPVADKVLLAVVFVALGSVGALPDFLVALVIGRDVLILGMCAYAYSQLRVTDFSPSVWGKISTIIQILTALIVLGQRAFPDPVLEAFGMVFVGLCALGTGWSGIHYLLTGRVLWQQARAARFR